jgi:hypothetical protein
MLAHMTGLEALLAFATLDTDNRLRLLIWRAVGQVL